MTDFDTTIIQNKNAILPSFFNIDISYSLSECVRSINIILLT